MKIEDQILKKALVEKGFVSEEDFQKAFKASQELDQPLADVLVFRGFLTEEALSQLLAEHYKAPYIDLKHKAIPLETLQVIPEELARRYRMIPFEVKEKENQLHLALENPSDFEAVELVKRKTGMDVIAYFTSPSSLRLGLSQYKKNIKNVFDKIIGENIKKTGKLKRLEDLSKVALILPVIKIFDTILQYAIAEKASDVHFETMEQEVIVRFRIDGILRDIISLPKSIGPALVARVKILAQLKIDEHRIPQDGRFKFSLEENEQIALRVSILPSLYGENMVLRILFESARALNLEELGLHGKNLKILQQEILKPNGMILVTGPTGCGKTTTLYSVLNILNSVEVKICTTEDPIEYGVHRVSQTQINPKAGLTFANSLRSLLRHDPDIIMVGEIRDKETAEIAVHAALTGHLVLSTLHTNDAPGAIPRLVDMGVEKFLLASTVNLVVAQRLVRKNCTRCVKKYKPSQEIIDRLKKDFNIVLTKITFYKGEGCQECGLTGYKGRVGIFEVFEITSELRELIMTKPSAEIIRKAALKLGMISMVADGIDKVAAGETSIEEILRVVKE